MTQTEAVFSDAAHIVEEIALGAAELPSRDEEEDTFAPQAQRRGEDRGGG